MKGRIKELLLKVVSMEGEDGELMPSLHTQQEIEQFAELIVEECRYVMDCNKGSDQHPEWNRALSETSDKIREHFGVE